MKKKCCFIFLLLIICMSFNVVYGAENETTRKIVSVVYDDSSLMDTNAKYYNHEKLYSAYTLQMITSLLGGDDKLSVTRTSSYYTSEEVDLTNYESKDKFIDGVNYYSYSTKHTFEPMNTAKKWLLEKASYNEDTAKYWLIVITNGGFSDDEEKYRQYIKEIENGLDDLEYEIIFLNLDLSKENTIKQMVESEKHSTYKLMIDEQGVCDAVFEIAKSFNLNADKNLTTVTFEEGNVIRVNAKYPLKILNVVVQDCSTRVKSIKKDGMTLALEDYVIFKNDSTLDGCVTRIICNTLNYLDAGEYEIQLDGTIDKSKILVLHESYFRPLISFVDENDNLLSKDTWIYSTVDDKVKVKCELYSAYDDSKIQYYDETKYFDVNVINNEKEYKLKFDKNKNAYYGYVNLEKNGNVIYALVEKDDIRMKSNIIAVNVYETPDQLPDEGESSMYIIEMEFLIPYSNKKKYTFVNKVRPVLTSAQDYLMNMYYEFENIPDGVIFEFQGKRYKANEKILADMKKDKIHEISVYSNRDYREKEAKGIAIYISIEDQLRFPLFWEDTGDDRLTIYMVPWTSPVKVKLEKEKEELYVTYSSQNKDRYIGEYNFTIEWTDEEPEMPSSFAMQLLNVPNGIYIEYDGTKYKNNDEILINIEKGRIYNLKIYANNEYVELDRKSIIFKLKSDVYKQEIFWTTTDNDEETIAIVPEIYPIKLKEIESTDKIYAGYSFSGEEKHIFKYTFKVENDDKNIGETFEIHLIDIPKGIVFEHKGNRYNNNERIPIVINQDEIYEIDIFSNSEYSEEDEKNIVFKFQSNLQNQDMSLNAMANLEKIITVCPKNNPVHIFNKGENEIDIQNELLELEIARVDNLENLNIVENVSLKNIKYIKDNSSLFSGFSYRIEEDENDNVLKIKFKPNVFCLMKDDELNVEIKIAFDNDIETAVFEQNVTFSNINMFVVLKPFIIMGGILVFVMGYIFKRKFDGDAQILVTEDGESTAYGLTPTLISLLIPYMSHKTKIGFIEMKALKNKELLCSVNGSEILKVNDEPFAKYIKENNTDGKKIIMQKNKSSIVIKDYDVTQRYEYIDSNNEMTEYDYKLDEEYLKYDQN